MPREKVAQFALSFVESVGYRWLKSVGWYICPFETLQRVGWTIQAKRDHVRMRNREMKYRLDMHPKIGKGEGRVFSSLTTSLILEGGMVLCCRKKDAACCMDHRYDNHSHYAYNYTQIHNHCGFWYK